MIILKGTEKQDVTLTLENAFSVSIETYHEGVLD